MATGKHMQARHGDSYCYLSIMFTVLGGMETHSIIATCTIS